MILILQEDNNMKKNGKIINCIICKKEFYVSKSRVERIKCCSRECADKSRPKQFCLRGHDTFICGRDKVRRCRKCRRKDPATHKKSGHAVEFYIKQFCVHGHEIAKVGRTNDGHCRECKREQGRIDPTKNSVITQFCPKGHDKDVVGRRKNGQCNECKRDYNKRYRIKNKKKVNRYSVERQKIDVNFKLRCHLRDRIIKAIRKGWKAGSAVRDLGCSIEFFKEYIAVQFHDEMTWENWGKIWQLDHIKELCEFDLTDRKQFLEAVNYKNMQPLTIPEHEKKTAKNATERAKKKRNKK